MESPRPKSPRFTRFASQVRSAGLRGREELTRKGGLGDRTHGLFRRWMRKIWTSRGGGTYAFGFAVTFLYLEFMDIVFDDIPQLVSIDWLSGEPIAFVVSFIVDTLVNTLLAFLWPIWLIQWLPPLGLILLVAAFALFPRLVQKPVEDWMFSDDDPDEKPAA